MKRMFKQWMAGLLAAVLVLTLLPAAALADQPDGEAELPAQETAEAVPEAAEPAQEELAEEAEEAAPEAELTALEDVPMAIEDTPFLNNGGNGSVGDPYQIANLEQLESFRNYINSNGGHGSGMYFKLTAPIDMSERYNAENGTSWTPIGTNNGTSFQGTFDGAGFAVSGLYINNTGSDWQGLFGCVEYGTVQNLTVSGSVTGDSFVGGIVGYNEVGGTILNCHSDCAVNCISSSAGGIAGSNKGTIQNCYNTGTISGDTPKGGIVGQNGGGTVKDCYNAGRVNNETDSILVGAVVGLNIDGGNTQNCYYLEGSCAQATQGGALKTAEAFKSGEVAYLLQKDQETQVWGQKLGDEADEYPVLTADSGKKVYKVTFQADGAEYAARYANPNGKVTLPEDPTKENYTFVKWAKTRATDGEKFDETTAVTGDMTVYAVSQPSFGGESGEIPLNVTYGQEVTADLDDYMAYENEDILPEGKFAYSIARDEDSTGARISGNTLTVPAGPGVGDHVITITATEKAPEYALMSVDSYGAEDVTLTVKVSVAKAAATVNPPTASAPLIYSGGAQALVTAGSLDCGGSVGCGTMKYSLTGGEDYDAAVPTAQDVGTYTVYWKVDGMVPTNCDYEGQTSGQISVTIHKSATPFLNNGGDGNADTPYQIANPEQLKAFRDYINKDISSSSGAGNGGDGEYFKLTNNIDLENEEWTPIGENAACKFRGVFDGDWHEISGLYISYGSYAGLFGRSSGTIQNLTISGSVNGRGFFGGLVGDNDGGTISNCGNKCAVNGSDSYVGGIAGENGGTIQNCYNAGVVSGTIFRGGIAGQSEEGSKVENCYNVGTVNNTESSLVGGVVGYANGTIQNCYYLDTCGAGNGYDDKDSVSKSAEAFKSGEVAWLLQNGQGSQVWGQTLGDSGDEYPVLTNDVDQKVCKVTFATEENESCAVRYANYNKTVATLPEEKPTKDHYTFAKWSQSNAADGVAFTTETKVTGDMTVYAVAQENFGGDSDTISLSAVYGQGATLDLSAHMAYENGSAAAGKFTYTIEGEDSKKFQIAGDTLTVPKTLDAGDYTLTITAKEKTPEYALVSVVDYGAEDVTLTVQVSVTPATATVTPPTAKTELRPSGAPQELIDPGSVACAVTGWGTMKYSLTGGSDYATTIPTAQNAGTYTVYWKIDGANETNFDYVGGTSGQVTAAIHRSSDPFLNDGGDGNEDTPYEIANLEQLESFRDHINSTGGKTWAHYKLTADIDMSEKYGADKGKSWTPIGTSDDPLTRCTFDGGGHTISGLYVVSEEYAGLFGYVGTSATVQNLAVSGSVTGTEYVGGIVGYNTNDIKNCHSDCTVSGTSRAGGIVGYNGENARVQYCYSVGPVSSHTPAWTGGIVGENHTVYPAIGTVENCYYRDDCGAGNNRGTAKAEAAFKSGEVAYLLQNGQGSQVWGQKLGDGGDESPVLTSSEDKKVYQITGEVEGQDSIVWYSNSTATLSATKPTKEYFTFAGWAKTPGAATADFTAGETVTDNMTVYAVWDLALAGTGEAETPYEIPDLDTLEAVREYVNGGRGAGEYFKLTASIDMSTKYGADKGEEGAPVSWTPIGTKDIPFQGTFDGDGRTISGLYITGSGIYRAGLFANSSGTIKNLTVSGTVNIDLGYYVAGIVGENSGGSIINCHNEASIAGYSMVGGIAGQTENGYIENCSNAGPINGDYSWTGGIAGQISNDYPTESRVKNCYNTGTVSGKDDVGGIAGQNFGRLDTLFPGFIQNCYNVGTVSGTGEEIGALVGKNGNSNNLTNCYYLATCGAAGEGTAKTAEEFNSGEVAWLLQNGQETQAWGQKLGDGADEYPVLTSEESEKVLKGHLRDGGERELRRALRELQRNGDVAG